MKTDDKKKHVVSYENLSAEILAIFNEKYPRGFGDYLPDLQKYGPYTNPVSGKEIPAFYAVTIETDTDVYLVKIKVKIDDAEDIERWLEGEEEAETEQMAGTTTSDDSESGTLPDDNISQYGSGDDDPAEG